MRSADRPTAAELKRLPHNKRPHLRSSWHSTDGSHLSRSEIRPLLPRPRIAAESPLPASGTARAPGPVNPIDLFLTEQRNLRGLTVRPPAPKDILLRRVYLDLIGLSPTPEEIAAFNADTRPDTYERVVDRLLASPRYGERWGRHWMDVWRYSDWAGWADGNQIRDSKPFIWRWRDWIVRIVKCR